VKVLARFSAPGLCGGGKTSPSLGSAALAQQLNAIKIAAAIDAPFIRRPGCLDWRRMEMVGPLGSYSPNPA
jgi:hypothetical protein